MTTNCVRSFDRSGSAPVSDPEESPTRREGALPRRVVRLFLGLQGLKRLNGLKGLEEGFRLYECTNVREYDGTADSIDSRESGDWAKTFGGSVVLLPAACCQLPALEERLPAASCELPAGCLRNNRTTLRGGAPSGAEPDRPNNRTPLLEMPNCRTHQEIL